MYQKVSTDLNFVDREKEVEKFWREHDIFKKSIEQRTDGETYTFYDGPPTQAAYRTCAYQSHQGYDSQISDDEGIYGAA